MRPHRCHGRSDTVPFSEGDGGRDGAHQAYVIPAGQGFKLRVDVNDSAGLRAASDSPYATPTGALSTSS